MKNKYRYDIVFDMQNKNNLEDFFNQIFEKSQTDTFYLRYFGDFRENPIIELIAGKKYPKDKLMLLIKDASTDKFGFEWFINDYFFNTVDKEYIYLESQNDVEYLFKKFHLHYYKSSGREKAVLQLFDD